MPKLSLDKSFLISALGLISTGLLGSTGLIIKNQLDERKIEAKNNPKQMPQLTSQANEIENVVAKNIDRHSPNNLFLATQLITKNQGQEALQQLENLEQNQPELTPYILLSRGQAYSINRENDRKFENWQQLIANYPDSPATAEALYLLGKANPAYWQEAIDKFPYHPRTHQLIRESLQKNPNLPKLMAILVKYTPEAPEVDSYRESLVDRYSNQLTPTDWEAIADSYWLEWDYGKAGRAYAKATSTSRNLYRAGRGYQLGNDQSTAKNYYLALLSQYPDAEETPLALLKLAEIGDKQQALTYLDRVIADFPEQAPDALIAKAKIFDALKSPVAAREIRELILTKYKSSDAAAEYRWNIASKYAQRGDLIAAWQWAQPIAIDNPESSLAPQASFWVGKWAQKLGRNEDAVTAFKSVLGRFPQSYYAWRSAVALGWDVGDFNTVRQMLPEVVKASQITLPPAGSKIFQELYQLGLTETAWIQFQSEIANKSELTVNEDFTLALMELSQGKHLRGINRIWYLQDRDNPEDKQQWEALRKTPQYWQGLFPFPYEDKILKWSQQRQLNPLLVTALIRQESRFEPEIRSSADAVGLMQLIPDTARSAAKQVKLPNYALTNPDDNINLGTYYLDYTHRKYQNNSMLAVASYNAGPNAVARWIDKYGLSDPDVFVEQIPYGETRGYVESVFENYWNYMLIYNPEIAKLFQL
jgi:soluble lytic murein transglycosylase